MYDEAHIAWMGQFNSGMGIALSKADKITLGEAVSYIFKDGSTLSFDQFDKHEFGKIDLEKFKSAKDDIIKLNETSPYQLNRRRKVGEIEDLKKEIEELKRDIKEMEELIGGRRWLA